MAGPQPSAAWQRAFAGVRSRCGSGSYGDAVLTGAVLDALLAEPAILADLNAEVGSVPTYDDVCDAISEQQGKYRPPDAVPADLIVDMLVDRGWLTVKWDPELRDG